MEWTTCIKRAIDYMEKNLLTISGPEEVAENAYISSMYLQKGFQIMTGFSLGEYMRNRKLYLAALDLVNTDEKIIDISFKYGYETPESFTKAFTRFHEVTPSDVRKKIHQPKVFLPLTVNVVIQGGSDMNCSIEKMSAFKVIGFVREFDNETSSKEIPQFWTEVLGKIDFCQYGICLDDTGKSGKFRYVIGNTYTGGEVPAGMEVVKIPEHLVARFDSVGPMPGALQAVSEKVFNEWLPGNCDYELDGNFDIECYSEGDMGASDYKAYVVIPVKRK